MENKKISLFLGLLAAGNILSLILVIGVIVYLTGGMAGRPIPKEIKTKVPEAIVVKDDAEVAKEAKSGVYVLEITDNGFKPEGLNALADQKVNLEVINKGAVPYVFEIKSLGIKETTINPGETKNFSAEPPADLEKETGFAYKAVSTADEAMEFKGMIIFTKSGK